ncbi:MAG: SDR family oxidoreductase [Ferrovum sp.]|nr:SDR family oxidoreductase [Ferrovum sp.]NDU88155.1 SDR family oxidoreductase [Ferrovum sp.]
MNLEGKKILLTGAAGGLGAPLAKALLERGCTLIISDFAQDALDTLEMTLRSHGKGTVLQQSCNLLDPAGVRILAAQMQAKLGTIDILINLAGLMSFNLFQDESEERLEQLWRVNVLAPMQLTRLLLPAMLKQGSGHIVNIGSVYGSIGFPGFATYSANKFALRGFSEALRRELDGTGLGVTYVGPRYIKTAFNTGVIQRMSEFLKVNMDDPEPVAQQIVKALMARQNERFIGFPESLFVRINGLFPSLVDGSIRKQLPTIREFATGKR